MARDHLDLALAGLEKRIYRAMLIQTGSIAAIVVAIMTLING